MDADRIAAIDWAFAYPKGIEWQQVAHDLRDALEAAEADVCALQEWLDQAGTRELAVRADRDRLRAQVRVARLALLEITKSVSVLMDAPLDAVATIPGRVEYRRPYTLEDAREVAEKALARFDTDPQEEP